MALARRVFVRGVGVTPVTANAPDATLTSMATAAATAALRDARVAKSEVTAVYVGNMCAPVLQRQSQVASLVATELGVRDAETVSVDAACGSGGAAVRLGVQAIRAGAHETVLVVGVERMTGGDADRAAVSRVLAQASHWEEEGARGATFVSLNSALTRAYTERYAVDPDDFFYIARNAHANAATAAHALLRKPIASREQYLASKTLAPQIRLFDACPVCDGAAALVLSASGARGQDVAVLGSGSRTDSLSLRRRGDLVELRALRLAAADAMREAGVGPGDVDVFEAHDAYSVMVALSLEACGFAAPGEAVSLAKAGELGLGGAVPVSTFGGLKARGHPVGATGVIQVAELVEQLRQRAGANQVPGSPSVGLAASFGGAATTVVTHVVGV